MYILLNTLVVTYNHKDIYSWILASFLNNCDAQVIIFPKSDSLFLNVYLDRDSDFIGTQ